MIDESIWFSYLLETLFEALYIILAAGRPTKLGLS
jgi:hypothetical protein